MDRSLLVLLEQSKQVCLDPTRRWLPATADTAAAREERFRPKEDQLEADYDHVQSLLQLRQLSAPEENQAALGQLARLNDCQGSVPARGGLQDLHVCDLDGQTVVEDRHQDSAAKPGSD